MQTSKELNKLAKLLVIPTGEWAVRPGNLMTNESIADRLKTEIDQEKPTHKGRYPMWPFPSYDDVRLLLQTQQQDPRFKFTVFFKPPGGKKFLEWRLNQPKTKAGAKLAKQAQNLKRQRASPPSS